MDTGSLEMVEVEAVYDVTIASREIKAGERATVARRDVLRALRRGYVVIVKSTDESRAETADDGDSETS